MRGNRRETGQATDLSSKVTEQVVTIGDRIVELGGVLISALIGAPPRIDVLEYQQVVDFFVAHRDGVPDAAAGALVRERTTGSGVVVQLVFLDAEGKPITEGKPTPPGRRYLVGSFDDELDELFGDSSLIVFN